MYEFWYEYVKPKHGKKAKLYFMDTDNFIVYIKTDDITKVLEEMLKQDLAFQIMNWRDHFLKEKKSNWINER